MVILLPNEDGSSSGEIVVTSMAGEVVMNEAWAATAITVSESPPTPPVLLQGLTMNFLNNLLIVNPPDEIQEAVDEQSGTASNILDVDLLEEDSLDEDPLEEDALEDEIGRLDIDLLAADFLTDLLIQVSASGKDAKVSELDGVQIAGIVPGFDPQAQVYTFVEGESLFLVRQVENTIDLELDKGASYSVDILTAGTKIGVEINGGGDNVIQITQSP